jgi:hypothetical protein
MTEVNKDKGDLFHASTGKYDDSEAVENKVYDLDADVEDVSENSLKSSIDGKEVNDSKPVEDKVPAGDEEENKE